MPRLVGYKGPVVVLHRIEPEDVCKLCGRMKYTHTHPLPRAFLATKPSFVERLVRWLLD